MSHGKHAIFNNAQLLFEFKDIDAEETSYFPKMNFTMIKWLLLTAALLTGQNCTLINDFFKEKELRTAVVFDCCVNKKGMPS